MFIDAMDAEMYDEHHRAAHCYLNTSMVIIAHGSPISYSCLRNMVICSLNPVTHWKKYLIMVHSSSQIMQCSGHSTPPPPWKSPPQIKQKRKRRKKKRRVPINLAFFLMIDAIAPANTACYLSKFPAYWKLLTCVERTPFLIYLFSWLRREQSNTISCFVI